MYSFFSFTTFSCKLVTTFTQFFFERIPFQPFLRFRKFSFYLWYLNNFLIRIFLSFLLLLDIFSFPNCKLCKNFFVWSHFVFAFIYNLHNDVNVNRATIYPHTILMYSFFLIETLFMPLLWYCCCCACFLFLTCFVTATTKTTATLMMRTETLLDRHSKAAMKLGFFLNERHSDVSFSSIILKSKQQVSSRKPVYLHLFLFYFCVFLILLHEV